MRASGILPENFSFGNVSSAWVVPSVGPMKIWGKTYLRHQNRLPSIRWLVKTLSRTSPSI